MTTEAPVLLDEALLALLGNGSSVLVSAASASLVPELAMAYGCTASPDRRRLRVTLDRRSAAAVLAVAVASGQVALVAARPMTLRALQIKGEDATVTALNADDRAMVERYRVDLGRELAAIGYPDPYLETLLASDPAELVCLDFRPTAVFDQTPGPQAGRDLAPHAAAPRGRA